MKRFLRAQRVTAAVMIAATAVALGIGLWPVRADVYGDASYSCGSGFLHSRHDWSIDSKMLEFQRTATNTATGLPVSACPDKVNSRRDLALLVMAFSLAIGLFAQILLERPRERNFGSTLFANRRRAKVRAPMPIRRVQSDESRVQPG